MTNKNICADSPKTFKRLFLNNTPFLDVRAPIEFDKGTFPTATNYPVLNTLERQQVGTCYKNEGQGAAIKLGYELISGDLKEQRINGWCDYLAKNPDAHLYCWRGGMRSNLTQQAIKEAGYDITLIPGGYKALRRVLINEIDETSLNTPIIVIGGKTGSAKTSLINELPTGVDLEGLAHHRGSSFGRRVKEPPCQVNFENALAIDLLKRRDRYPNSPIFLEDESRNVGPVSMPLNFWQAMTKSAWVIVDMPIEFRVKHIVQEYVLDMLAEHQQADTENGFENYRQYLLASLSRIKKRLGGERYCLLESMLNSAINEQERSACVSAFEACITLLLERYYDPMYEYQLAKKQSRVIFRGDYDEVHHWLLTQSSIYAKPA